MISTSVDLSIIGHLDFKPTCTGLLYSKGGSQGREVLKIECDDIAAYSLHHDCGCVTLKCVDHYILWLRDSVNYSKKYGDRVHCLGCSGYRHYSKTITHSL